jgi:hypothetical protein
MELYVEGNVKSTTVHHACTFLHSGSWAYFTSTVVAGTIICFVTYSMGMIPFWETNPFAVKFPAFYGTRRFITTFKSARHSVWVPVFRNHLPELGHIMKRVADSCFGRKLTNSVNRIGMLVWNGSCGVFGGIKNLSLGCGLHILVFNMVDLVLSTRCVQMLGHQIL